MCQKKEACGAGGCGGCDKDSQGFYKDGGLPVHVDALMAGVGSTAIKPTGRAAFDALRDSPEVYNWRTQIEAVKSFGDLVPVSHQMAIEKGWWQEGIPNRPACDILANYHSEVSEAWEEYRAHRMDTWFGESGKPEGFWIEIADLLIRIADAVGAGREEMYETLSKHVNDLPVANFITRLHELLACGKDAVTFCECFAKRRGVDLYEAVRTKLTYNATRPYRHGGKAA